MANEKLNKGIEIGSWIVIAAGIVLAATPLFVNGLTTIEYWTDIVVGVALVAMAGFDAWAGATGRASSTWATNALSVMLGLWVIAYPIYAASTNVYLWLNVSAGAVVAIVSAYDVWESLRPTKGGKPMM